MVEDGFRSSSAENPSQNPGILEQRKGELPALFQDKTKTIAGVWDEWRSSIISKGMVDVDARAPIRELPGGCNQLIIILLKGVYAIQ